ncbi:MAG TPA: tyrosine-type recombinase/integrase [Vicinamibacteria bacterium]|nr:tyrosine-type recombinase/integrase [Vicinamibacteria bacterium]
MRLLKKRLAEMGSGRLVGPDPEKVTLADLRQMLVDDYGLKGNRTTARAEQSMAHVTEHFGEQAKALDVTADGLVAYARRRREAGAASATVKNELAALRRAFNLAVRAGRLPQRPFFPVLEARNRRVGFFERTDFERVLAHLPAGVASLAEFLDWSGWRKGEALGLEWRSVDADAGVLRIEDSKNREPRTLPYKALPALAAVIDGQRERTSAVEQAKGIIVRSVFHRDGKPIRDFRRVWVKACIAAGLGREEKDAKGKIIRRVAFRMIHDNRRTAARNMSRAGVPEGVIMALCGWKTRSVFDRYRIVNEADLADGLGKLAAAQERQGQPEAASGNVAAFRKVAR